MKRFPVLLQCLIIALLVLSAAGPVGAKDAGFQTGFTAWRGAGAFADWNLNKEVQGTQIVSGTLQMDFATAQPGTDNFSVGGWYGGNYYNGGSFVVGEAVSPEISTSFALQEAIASWDADTPTGTWIETQMRANLGGRWTKWYIMGIWASDYATINRHSVNLQGDADGYVAIDTLVLSKGKVPADKLQLKVRLFSEDGVATPVVRSMSVTYSTSAPKKVTPSVGNSTNWNTLLDVPECSQMVYPDGGNVWCSPTSVSMVLGFWGILPGPCEQRVRETVDGVYDWKYDGHGNWPFNTAFSASKGLEGYVVRYTSMDRLEPWVKAGVPVVMSIAWGKNDLTYAPIPASSGHLVVLVGFDAKGDPIVNDPAASADLDVQRTYIRAELEQAWLTNSSGTVYLIFPQGMTVPGF